MGINKKISLIGAGSGCFSTSLIGGFCSAKALSGAVVSLMDIDEARLDAVYQMCVRLNELRGGNLRFEKTTDRTDVNVFYVPATKLAEENGLKGLSNIILVGKLFKEVGFCSAETLDTALQKCIPARKASMLDFNRKAIEIGSAL